MISFGTDPEFMIVDKEGGAVSAIDSLQEWSRENRLKQEGHEFFYDNVLAEVAVRPSFSKEEAVESIRSALQIYADLVAPNYLKAQASREYPQKLLEHKDAIEAGCSADECAYQMMVIEPETDMFVDQTLRSGGGHVHVGTDLTKEISCGATFLTRMLDLFLGVPSVLIDKDPTSKRRRELYGHSGRFRKKEYGMEYRTLGNFWLVSPNLVELVYDLTEFTEQFVASGRHTELWKVDEERLQSEEFWMTDGDISNCHHCEGYDLDAVKKSIATMDEKSAVKLYDEVVTKYLPESIRRSIEVERQASERNLYKEWNIQ